MSGYLSRRLALSAATLLLITAAVYTAIRLVPGTPTWDEDPASGPPADTWLRRYHVLDPIPIGYARWLADVARFDLGMSVSIHPGRPVAELVAEALPYTILLGSIAMLLTLVVALPLGVLSAWRPDSLGARAWIGLLYLLHALPVFWIALALQHVVAGRLHALPPLGPGPPGLRASGPAFLFSAPYWVLPTLAITLGSLAFVIRFCSSQLLEASGEEYVRAARARGASQARVLWRDALANSGVALISLMGLMLPSVVSGSVLVETVFALPGLGRLFVMAVSRRDYPVIMALSLLTAAATLIASLAADLLYRAVDPRVVLDDETEAAA